MYVISIDRNKNITSKSECKDSVNIPQGFYRVTEQQYNSIVFPAKVRLVDGEINIENINKTTILTEEIIDEETVQNIRKRYSVDEEMKMLRLGIVNSEDIDFTNYNNYVEQCRQAGRVKKQILGGE